MEEEEEEEEEGKSSTLGLPWRGRGYGGSRRTDADRRMDRMDGGGSRTPRRWLRTAQACMSSSIATVPSSIAHRDLWSSGKDRGSKE